MNMIIYIMENHQYALFLCVNQDNPYRSQYEEKVNQHNSQLTQNRYIDSGFDLFVPKEINMMVHEVNKVDFDVKCEMKRRENGEWVPTGFICILGQVYQKQSFGWQIMWVLLIVVIVEI